MKIGIFSDLHLHNHKPFAVPVGGGVNSRAAWCIDTLGQITEIAREEKLAALCFCGDFWHTRGYVLVSLFQLARQAVREMAEVCPVLMIGGNHDAGTTEDDPPNAITLFEDIGGVTILDDRPTLIPGKKSVKRGWADALIMGASNGKLPEMVPYESNDKIAQIAILHLTIQGTKINPNGWEAEHGISMGDLADWLEEHHISACFIGDIHLRQELFRNVWYVGNCIQLQFGEDQGKGMLIYDTEEDRVEFYQLNTPQFLTLEDEFDVDDQISAHSGNYYRVRTTTQETWEKLSRRGNRNVRVLPPPKEVRERRSNLRLDTSVEGVLKEWVERNAPKGMDKKRLLKLGMEFLP